MGLNIQLGKGGFTDEGVLNPNKPLSERRIPSSAAPILEAPDPGQAGGAIVREIGAL
ncbi:MAG: hypothetical protein HRJ53_04780 [Acidobacteria bacterium Pan2503]|uniref:Uncharacterized protein n=1 Tax=Candidatus Acidiferrum panamense TaxID=2741543 RepID=A0A7V8NN31_9BACT|nr:hypothetical protein [Candidatus Acidoferrum panamensis]